MAYREIVVGRAAVATDSWSKADRPACARALGAAAIGGGCGKSRQKSPRSGPVHGSSIAV